MEFAFDEYPRASAPVDPDTMELWPSAVENCEFVEIWEL
jgi:hypothetical protein